MAIDLSPRKIWFGIIIPGKKMMRLVGFSGTEAGKELLRVYAAPPHEALLAVAYGLYALPKDDRYDKQVALKDMRDFVKLRFKAPGRSNENSSPVDPSDPDANINYLITGLGLLAAQPQGSEALPFIPTLQLLVKVARGTARNLDNRWGRVDEIDRYLRDEYEQEWQDWPQL
jgi:hypothetical protein